MPKIKPFTDRQLKKYKNIQTHCPKCGNDSMTSGHFEYGEGESYVLVECDRCHFEWNNIYTLTGAGERSFSEVPENLTIKKGTEVCVEFTIQGVGWGETIEEAWEACKEGMNLDKMSDDDAHPSIIDERKLGG